MEFTKERTLDWLETNRNNGVFKGHPEDTMDFHTLDDDDLEWYFYEWMIPSLEPELDEL